MECCDYCTKEIDDEKIILYTLKGDKNIFCDLTCARDWMNEQIIEDLNDEEWSSITFKCDAGTVIDPTIGLTIHNSDKETN